MAVHLLVIDSMILVDYPIIKDQLNSLDVNVESCLMRRIKSTFIRILIFGNVFIDCALSIFGKARVFFKLLDYISLSRS